MHLFNSKSSFTLAEILVTIAILAVISTAVVIVINPVEYLKRARDSQRLSDLTNLSKILSWFEADTGGREFMGTSSVVYVSIPDSTSTCANLGLPPLPSGWSYRCVSSSTLQNTDGTGWIPVNFSKLSFGKTLPKLPIDPINTTSSGHYYTYVTGGSFKLTSRFESERFILQHVATDGGSDPALFEIGTNLSLAPFVGGLVGYWSFDEGSGTIAYDRSGWGRNGNLSIESWNIGKINSGLRVGTSSAIVNILNSNNLQFNNDFTVLFWIKPPLNNTSDGISIFQKNGAFSLNLSISNSGCTYSYWRIRSYLYDPNTPGNYYGWWTVMDQRPICFPLRDGNWHFLGASFQNKSIMRVYDGDLVGERFLNPPINVFTNNNSIIIGDQNTNNWGNQTSTIDEVYLYNKTLSDYEIKSIYNATK